MELQFPKKEFNCLLTAVCEIKNEEHTQEIRLTDAMPDAGKILGCWGQVLIRSKEWRGSSMSVSGGIMARILYAPEDNSAPETIESWLPFQMKWDLTDSKRDGQILVNLQLSSLDARLVSARKMMLRACVSAVGKGLEPGKLEVYTPIELPEDVQILKRSYPVQLPVEAGEKTFFVEEALRWPAGVGPVEKVIYYSVLPEIQDQKVMADKAVFRGTSHIHTLCMGNDGQLRHCDFDVGFSQFAYLGREYGTGATLLVVPAVTSAELEIGEDGQPNLKAGIISQYVICDTSVLEVVEDAYSPHRSIALKMGELAPGNILDSKQETVAADFTEVEDIFSEIVDNSFFLEQPNYIYDENKWQVEQKGSFQVLGYLENGEMESRLYPWEHTMEVPSAEDVSLKVSCMPKGFPQAFVSPAGMQMQSNVLVDMWTVSREILPMVIGLELEEEKCKDPNRPSLILRRAEGEGLWQIAKHCGSSIEVIRMANSLVDDPQEGQILLIPVV